MAAYMAIMLLQDSKNIFLVYPLKIGIVVGLLWVFHNRYEELRPSFSWLAVPVGLVAIGYWIVLDPYYPQFKADLFDARGKWMFIGFRVVGAVLVVPLMEELFWRGFLIRWLVDEDFKKVPIGVFTWPSFAITVALFSMEHSQWLAGAVCGVFYNWLYYRTKSLCACVIAHAVSNAALAAWVLWFGDWKFW